MVVYALLRHVRLMNQLECVVDAIVSVEFVDDELPKRMEGRVGREARGLLRALLDPVDGHSRARGVFSFWWSSAFKYPRLAALSLPPHLDKVDEPQLD